MRRAVGIYNPPTQQQIIKMMEQTMNGIMEVVVEPARDALKCFICRRPRPISSGNYFGRHAKIGVWADYLLRGLYSGAWEAGDRPYL